MSFFVLNMVMIFMLVVFLSFFTLFAGLIFMVAILVLFFIEIIRDTFAGFGGKEARNILSFTVVVRVSAVGVSNAEAKFSIFIFTTLATRVIMSIMMPSSVMRYSVEVESGDSGSRCDDASGLEHGWFN